MTRRIWPAALAALAVAACTDEAPLSPAPEVAGPSFTLGAWSGSDLGAFGSTTDWDTHHSYAEGINDNGVIVGRNRSPYHAIQWSPGAGLQDVHAAPYTSSLAKAINEFGVTTGHAIFGGWGAYRQEPGGAMEYLGALEGNRDSFGEDINSLGVVAGYANITVGQFTVSRAFRASPGGQLQNLGLPAGFPEDASSAGSAINDAGTVVGHAVCRGCADSRPFRAEVGGPMQLLNVPSNASAEDINNHDVIVGNYRAPDSLPVYRAYLREADGTVRRLPVPVDAPGNAWVHGLNDLGDAVGEVGWSDGVQHAVLWPAEGGIVDLGRGTATAINDQRVIAGHGPAADGHVHAMRWTPPPVRPTAASDVRAGGAGAGRVNVLWTDNSYNEERFRVRRAVRNPDGSFGTYVIIGNRGPNNGSFLDSTVVVGSTYRYQIQTCNAAGCSYSTPSNALTVVPLPAAPSGLLARTSGIQTVDLTWTDNATNESSYRVRRSTRDSTGVYGPYATLRVVGANSSGDTDATVAAGTTYRYQVQACNGGGCSTSGTVVISIPPRPTAPHSLAGSVVSAARIDLSWGDGSSNETSFRVRRSTRNGDGTWGAFQLVETLGSNTTAHQDGTVGPSSTHRYYVQACNAGGCSNSGVTPALTTPAAP